MPVRSERDSADLKAGTGGRNPNAHFAKIAKMPELKRKDGKIAERSIVYFIVRDSEVIYVGQTHRPNTRLLPYNHSKFVDGDAIYYVPCEAAKRLEMEARLIWDLKPRWNRCVPDPDRPKKKQYPPPPGMVKFTFLIPTYTKAALREESKLRNLPMVQIIIEALTHRIMLFERKKEGEK
jgi:hypothetical protein